MKLLALDTATEACSVALWLDGKVLEHFDLAGREHTARLGPMLHSLLAQAGLSLSQFDGLVCGIGPGSFAGVRVGVSYVKGLALGLDRPVIGVDTLAMLAQGAVRRHAAREILPAIDARMNEVYFGAYRGHQGLATAQIEPAVLAPQQIAVPAFEHATLIGSGWAAHREALLARLPFPASAQDDDAWPHAQDALSLALPQFEAGRAIDAAQLAPLYLRNRVALTLEEQKRARL
jgi:tRNA threonylcarbamoyladenosine biosynthesis protein TsaB